jgi:hypothetical protein
MATDIQEIVKRQDLAYAQTLRVREKASDDLMFSRYTQWDDYIEGIGLEYRGEFNLIWKERQRLLSEMRANQIAPNFKPIDNADPDAADILNGMYIADMRNNRAKEAVDVAVGDMIDCGYGAWRLFTEYVDSDDDMDNRQVIRREPIHEANNVVFFDPNAKRMDKSDAKYVTIISQLSKEGFEQLAEEYGFEPDMAASFSQPSQSYVYPWNNIAKQYTIGEYYERVKKTEKIVIMEHPALGRKVLKRSEVKEVLDDMIASGWVTIGQKKREYYIVEKYLVTGAKVLHGPERIAGEHLPVVPVYGNWFFLEGSEIWSGITRLAKDPQRLYNMQMSFLADIAAKGARNRPVLFPEQVQGFQHMWENQNSYPYLLMNRKAADGTDLPPGPANYIQNEQVPQATLAILEATRMSVEDVTSPGMPQDVLDPAASGKAIGAVQARIDNQSFVYMDNLASAMRRDAEVYLSMARAIYDTSRDVKMMDMEGNESEARIMEQVQDLATGQWVTLNDITKGKFEVYVDVGPAWQSQKQKARDEIIQLMQATADPEIQRVLQLQYVMLLDGSQFDVLRKLARRQMLQMGAIEPESEEDMQYMQQLQANAQQGDPQQMAVAQALQAQAIKDQAMAEKAQADTIGALALAEERRAKTAETLAKVDAQALDNAERLAMALRGNIMQQRTMLQ